MTKETIWLLTEYIQNDYNTVEYIRAVFKDEPTVDKLEKYIDGESIVRSKLIHEKGSDIELGRYYWYRLEEKELE